MVEKMEINLFQNELQCIIKDGSAMIKGAIQSEVIEDIQAELENYNF